MKGPVDAGDVRPKCHTYLPCKVIMSASNMRKEENMRLNAAAFEIAKHETGDGYEFVCRSQQFFSRTEILRKHDLLDVIDASSKKLVKAVSYAKTMTRKGKRPQPLDPEEDVAEEPVAKAAKVAKVTPTRSASEVKGERESLGKRLNRSKASNKNKGKGKALETSSQGKGKGKGKASETPSKAMVNFDHPDDEEPSSQQKQEEPAASPPGPVVVPQETVVVKTIKTKKGEMKVNPIEVGLQTQKEKAPKTLEALYREADVDEPDPVEDPKAMFPFGERFVRPRRTRKLTEKDLEVMKEAIPDELLRAPRACFSLIARDITDLPEEIEALVEHTNDLANLKEAAEERREIEGKNIEKMEEALKNAEDLEAVSSLVLLANLKEAKEEAAAKEREFVRKRDELEGLIKNKQGDMCGADILRTAMQFKEDAEALRRDGQACKGCGKHIDVMRCAGCCAKITKAELRERAVLAMPCGSWFHIKCHEEWLWKWRLPVEGKLTVDMVRQAFPHLQRPCCIGKLRDEKGYPVTVPSKFQVFPGYCVMCVCAGEISHRRRFCKHQHPGGLRRYCNFWDEEGNHVLEWHEDEGEVDDDYFKLLKSRFDAEAREKEKKRRENAAALEARKEAEQKQAWMYAAEARKIAAQKELAPEEHEFPPVQRLGGFWAESGHAFGYPLFGEAALWDGHRFVRFDGETECQTKLGISVVPRALEIKLAPGTMVELTPSGTQALAVDVTSDKRRFEDRAGKLQVSLPDLCSVGRIDSNRLVCGSTLYDVEVEIKRFMKKTPGVKGWLFLSEGFWSEYGFQEEMVFVDRYDRDEGSARVTCWREGGGDVKAKAEVTEAVHRELLRWEKRQTFYCSGATIRGVMVKFQRGNLLVGLVDEAEGSDGENGEGEEDTNEDQELELSRSSSLNTLSVTTRMPAS